MRTGSLRDSCGISRVEEEVVEVHFLSKTKEGPLLTDKEVVPIIMETEKDLSNRTNSNPIQVRPNKMLTTEMALE